MMSEARAAVVAGHGAFAEGLLSAVAQVMGVGHGLVAVTNADRTPAGIEAAIQEALERTGATVLFTVTGVNEAGDGQPSAPVTVVIT